LRRFFALARRLGEQRARLKRQRCSIAHRVQEDWNDNQEQGRSAERRTKKGLFTPVHDCKGFQFWLGSKAAGNLSGCPQSYDLPFLYCRTVDGIRRAKTRSIPA
jgi:hypothetical protein